MKIVIYPREEQKEIVSSLHSEALGVQAPISACELAVNLLKDRRTVLISAAVTGKIDVRNWQAPESISTPSTDA